MYIHLGVLFPIILNYSQLFPIIPKKIPIIPEKNLNYSQKKTQYTIDIPSVKFPF